ncbi:hypothetical protein [uncultured Allofournierella sp.]|uniref:hypothetical protein n=1 Tax=uncultured Allofournierella sp. TaxID=1940258 RepID=UPI0037510814
MIKLIVGTKGTGKTKAMIDSINAVTKTTNGNVVVVEKSMQLTYDIDHAARLIDLDRYNVAGYDMMFGFVAGVLAGNYDITELYIDGLLKVVDKDLTGLAKFLADVEAAAGDTNVTITLSTAEETLPEEVKKYL